MNRLSDICQCAREPMHTIGFCAMLQRAERKERVERSAKLVYASKLDVKLRRAYAKNQVPPV